MVKWRIRSKSASYSSTNFASYPIIGLLHICFIYVPPSPIISIYLPLGSLVQNLAHHYTRRVRLKALSHNPEFKPPLHSPVELTNPIVNKVGWFFVHVKSDVEQL